MPKFTRVSVVVLFVLIAIVAVLSIVRFGRETSASARLSVDPAAVSISAVKTATLVTTGCPGASTTDLTCNGLVNPGDTIRYTVTITNGGPDPASNVIFTDTLPDDVSLVGGSVDIL